jgi:hypothetical protein
MELGLIFFAAAAVYFLPSWIGSSKQNRTSIFLLNLFLGWTLIGWVVALVWATTKEAVPQQSPRSFAPLPAAIPAALPLDPQARIARLKELRDQGAITQDEFLALVDKAL